ncbi:MAG: cytidylate kinase family protein, partial [Desulfobacterales bacterium]|nr:cytidylate kinase family protein [Desulfobacterales bacterium]
DISHVLNIRIIADLSDRIAFMRQKHNISEKESISYITEEDSTRARWAHYLYKVDLTDPHSYDMTIRVKRMNIEDAAETICHAARRETFAATPDSKKAIADLALSSRVKAAIENYCKPDLKVSVNATSGIVYIKAETHNVRKTGYTSFKTEEYLREKTKKEITDEIGAAINGIPGIENVLYDVEPPAYT